MVKITVSDRNYSSYQIVDSVDSDVIDPIKNKLFHNDVFSLNGNIAYDIISETRNANYLAGVLILDDNKTYGRSSNKKRFLYKCVPNNKYLPYFLVPYEVKLGLNKKTANKFILFKFHAWEESNCHPTGIITQSIGDVDDENAFHEYQLFSRGLNGNIKLFTQKTNLLVCDEPHIADKTKFIFSIDPKNCTDHDDAFSFTYDEFTKTSCVSVYFSNVVSVIEKHDLWAFFSERVSTIYLPGRRIPILPATLSNVCSLQSNKTRSTFSVNFYFDNDGNLLENLTALLIVSISVDKNFFYEDREALSNCSSYLSLHELTLILNPSIKDSRDVVSYWMIKTNTYCANFLNKHKKGIFRIPSEVKPNIVTNEWNRISSQYVRYNNTLTDDKYSHFTSPIRRIVDLLNQIEIYSVLLPHLLSCSSQTFFDNWCLKIEYINQTTKSIRKIEIQCNLIHFFSLNTSMWNNEYDGIIVEKKDANPSFSYTVYIEKLNVFARVSKSILDFQLQSIHRFKFYIFDLEHDTRRKIRLSIV